MADSVVPIKDFNDAQKNVSTRTNASGEHIQVISVGIDGSDSIVPADAANGLDVDVTRVTGTVTVDTELTTGDMDTGGGTDTRAVVGLVGSASGGGQLIPGDATNGLLVNVSLMPGAARTTDALGAALATDVIMNAFTALTPKFAKASIAASTTDGSVVAAVTSKKIRPLLFSVSSAGTASTFTFNSKPAGAGSAISQLFTPTAAQPWGIGFSPVGIGWETVAGEGLAATTGAGSNSNVSLVYLEV